MREIKIIFLLSNFERFAGEFKEQYFNYKRFEHFLTDLDTDVNSRGRQFGTYFDSVEHEVIEEDRKIIDLVDSYTKIKENLETLVEKKCVYDKSFQLIQSNSELSQHLENDNGMLEEGHQLGFQFLAGVIKAEDDIKMKRMIFRASRGTALPTFFDFVNNEIVSNNNLEQGGSAVEAPLIKKKIFTIFFQGGRESFLLHKLLKICDLYGASRYNIPRQNEIGNVIRELHIEINQLKYFLREAEISIKNFLKDKLGSVSKISLSYLILCRKCNLGE